MSLDARQYQRMADATGPVFFDRGVMDALGMVNQLGLISAAELKTVLESYPYFRKPNSTLSLGDSTNAREKH